MKILFNKNIYCNTVVIKFRYIIRYMSKNTNMSTFESLKFDNLALRKLPIDPEEKNYVRTVNGACFSKVKPDPLINPSLVAWSASAIQLLDLSESEMNRRDAAEYFSGNKLFPGSDPAAHCYCGHQFGAFAGQLGDGAAMYLGEVINKKNERWEIQLKGAGLTPYSRTADGRKVLRSSIREFLCSEAMHFLGIPTSRAGTCVTSDSKVIRDMFYDGNPKEENCAVILRIAPTFIRFGSFEIFKTLDQMTGRFGPSVGRVDILHGLLNYVIDTFYPQISEISCEQQKKYTLFFKEVVLRTAKLVAGWQSVGFCHGVLNTDNMSIMGLTLDYGPFGFMDVFNPHHVCNSSDNNGRYTYIKQPEICLWNLRKFAESIQQALPLDATSPILDLYQAEYHSTFLKKMRSKLGLIASEFSDDTNLLEDLFNVMDVTGADFTNTFVCLSSLDANILLPSSKVVLKMLVDNCYSLDVMINNLSSNNLPHVMPGIISKLKEHPALIPNLERAGIPVQLIISQLEKMEQLKTFTKESKHEYNKNQWDEWLGKYIKRVEADMKSYSGDTTAYNEERFKVMTSNNPRFILRNHLLQEAITKAEKGDHSQVKNVLERLEKPYDLSYETIISKPLLDQIPKQDSSSSTKAYENAPDWAFAIKVS